MAAFENGVYPEVTISMRSMMILQWNWGCFMFGAKHIGERVDTIGIRGSFLHPIVLPSRCRMLKASCHRDLQYPFEQHMMIMITMTYCVSRCFYETVFIVIVEFPDFQGWLLS